MKIIQFTAENVKKLRAVEITPAGNLVQITGRNGSGKSSVLDSIHWALAGTREMQAQPIRQGETAAVIKLELGNESVELLVTRKITEKGSTLTVESMDGARFPAPQAMIDKILGALSFDPLAFVRQKPKEQFDTLRELVNIDIDFEKFDALQRGDFQRRAELNKDLKTARAQLDTLPAPVGDIPAKIDTAALVDKIAEAGKHNANIERTEEQRRRWCDRAEMLAGIAASHRADAEKLRKQAEVHDAAAAENERDREKILEELAAAPPLPMPIDPAALRKQLTEAESTNRTADQEQARRDRRAALSKDVERLEAEAAKLTARMETRERQKNEAIAAAAMPVPGIGFGQSAVLLNGLPFEQASSAEQLRASAAIAMAANPKLRVLRIKDGSLLDENGLKLLEELAAAKDYQIWIERVDASGAVGFVMEEGEVHRAGEGEESRPPSPTGSATSTADTFATSPPVVPVEEPDQDDGGGDGSTFPDPELDQLLEDLEHEPDLEDPYACPDCKVNLTEEAGEPCLLCRNGITADRKAVTA